MNRLYFISVEIYSNIYKLPEKENKKERKKEKRRKQFLYQSPACKNTIAEKASRGQLMTEVIK